MIWKKDMRSDIIRRLVHLLHYSLLRVNSLNKLFDRAQLHLDMISAAKDYARNIAREVQRERLRERKH